MNVYLTHVISLSDFGNIGPGDVDLPDNLAAALLYQGVAKLSQPSPAHVAAVAPPMRRGKREHIVPST